MRTLTRYVLTALAAVAISSTGVVSDAQAQDCKAEVKAKLENDLKRTPEMITQAKSSYELNCASCHGNGGAGDGPAGKVLNPQPRNFAKDAFKKGTSVLAIYNTLTLGLPGTNMAAFDTLPEGERLALSHYVRDMMPKEKWEETTPEQLEEACIEISNPKLPSIPVELAMEIIAEEAEKGRQSRPDMGPVKTNKAGEASSGKLVFGARCASCHGQDTKGMSEYGRYGRTPYVFTSTFPLQRNVAYGDWAAFADRTASGAHATLPDLTDVATLSAQDWKDLQSYLSTLDGSAKVEDDAPTPAPGKSLLSVGDGYELIVLDGAVMKLTTRTEATEAPLARVGSYDEFKKLYKGAQTLPETLAQPLVLKAIVGLTCIGARQNNEGVKPGCGQLAPEATKNTADYRIDAKTFETSAPNAP